MKINAIKCKKCGDIVYSRATSDFHYCSCKEVAIDGGLNYRRILGEPEDYESLELDLPVSPKELYEDWDRGKDIYGLIKQEWRDRNRDSE